MDSLEQAEQRYHAALADFVKGDAGPALQMFSQRDDVVLCNPFYPYAKGPDEVAKVTGQAASHFADGTIDFEQVTMFSAAEFGYTVQIERFRAIIDGTEGSGALRATTIFRLEEDGWRIAHRHADPITTPQAVGSILQK
jgi:ketosteroid isomerase-like protein